MKKKYIFLDRLITPILYFCIFYITASVIKWLYLLPIILFNLNRITVLNKFYLDELVTIIVTIILIHKYIKIESVFKKYIY